MIETNKVQAVAEHTLFSNDFVFHGLSRPVLHKTKNGYCLAMFVTLFSSISFKDGLFERPEYIVLCDLEDGSVLEFEQTNLPGFEFCEATYARRYDLNSTSETKRNARFYEETYSLLDDVRKELIQTGTFDEKHYRVYMKRILKEVPVCYRQFFRALSVPF